MKLYKFYPEDYKRMYVIGTSARDIIDRGNQLFDIFIKSEYEWIDVDDPDEAAYMEEKRETFNKGLTDVEEVVAGAVVDSHY